MHELNICIVLICPSTQDIYIYVSIYLSLYLSLYLCIYLSIYVSIYLSIHLSFYLAIYLCTYLSIYLCINLCIFLSIYLSIYPSIHQSIISQPFYALVECDVYILYHVLIPPTSRRFALWCKFLIHALNPQKDLALYTSSHLIVIVLLLTVHYVVH